MCAIGLWVCVFVNDHGICTKPAPRNIGFDLDMFLGSLPIAVGGGLPAVASWPRAPTWGIIRSCQ